MQGNSRFDRSVLEKYLSPSQRPPNEKARILEPECTIEDCGGTGTTRVSHEPIWRTRRARAVEADAGVTLEGGPAEVGSDDGSGDVGTLPPPYSSILPFRHS